MKTRTWIILLCALLLISVLACIPLLSSKSAGRAKITSDGEVITIVDLRVDQQFTVESDRGGSNTITVKDGAIAVTEADCPDHYCMHRGFCDGGTQIVCLPNRLVISFLDEAEVDFVAG